MSRLSRGLSRHLRIADPGLRPLVPRLAAGVSSGRLALAPAKTVFQAVGDPFLSSSGPTLSRRGGMPLIILQGPTPENALRLPASIICIPAAAAVDLAAFDRHEFARQLVTSVPQDRAAGTFAFCDFWQTSGISCDKAGETVDQNASGRSIENILVGQRDTGIDHPLWAAVLQACKEAGIAQTLVIDHVLTRHTLWFSPYTGQPISPAEAAAICGTMQRHWQENDRPGHCFGAQYWNHPSIKATFSGRGGEVRFHETEAETLAAARESNGRVFSWAGRTSPELEAECANAGISLSRIEDGFLRSVGLGAGLARGAMLAVDDLGIYYDPSRPSRLEMLLRDYDLTQEEQARGRALVDLIRQARISKYNFGKSRSYTFPSGTRTILVPGQVADDAAIRKSRSATIDCANTPNVNLDLLRLARARHPHAFLVFKPHPDVETGLRKGKVARETALQFADSVAEDANIIDLIEAVDCVETFSSLSGYEALLRGKSVAVHGAPFYAGWGLCEDLTPLEGRGRQRDLSELVYLSLVAYARTIDPVTLLPCTPEFLISRLAEQRTDRKHLLVSAARRHISWLGRKLGL